MLNYLFCCACHREPFILIKGEREHQHTEASEANGNMCFSNSQKKLSTCNILSYFVHDLIQGKITIIYNSFFNQKRKLLLYQGDGLQKRMC